MTARAFLMLVFFAVSGLGLIPCAFGDPIVYGYTELNVGGIGNTVTYTFSINSLAADRKSGDATFTVSNSKKVTPPPGDSVWLGLADFKLIEGNYGSVTFTGLNYPDIAKSGVYGWETVSSSGAVPSIITAANGGYGNNYLPSSSAGFIAQSLIRGNTPTTANLIPLTGTPSTYSFELSFALSQALRNDDTIPFQNITYTVDGKKGLIKYERLSVDFEEEGGSPPNTVVPEPATLVLLGLGLVGAGFLTRLRRK